MRPCTHEVESAESRKIASSGLAVAKWAVWMRTDCLKIVRAWGFYYPKE
jgi:hypothetical protein